MEITNSLPLITVSRLMLTIFFMYAFINRKKTIDYIDIFHTLPKTYIFLFSYFFFRIVSNCYYITIYRQSITAIFSIIFEQLCPIIAVFLLQPTKEQTTTIIKTTVYSASALFAIGILESYTRIRPFDSLYTVQREMLNEHYIRLGLYRATTSLGLPVFYGNMCIIILPLILFLYSYYKEKKYLFILLLNLFATIHSGSRADIIFFITIIGLYFIIRLILNDNTVLFLRNIIIILSLSIFIMTSLSFTNKYAKYFYEGTFQSVLNEFGFSFDVEKSAPSGTDGFGTNKHGVSSRTFQFTGVQYAFSKNPLFGLGAGALENNQVYYNGWGEWTPYHSYDMGIVEVLISEGLLGFTGYLCFFIFICGIMIPHLKTIRNSPPSTAITLLPFVYLLSTLSTANMHSFMIFIAIIFILYFYMPIIGDSTRCNLLDKN